jgi:hypothetical protein
MFCPWQQWRFIFSPHHLSAITRLLLFDCVCRYYKRQVLPEDFHVQTLFVGKPRVACTIAKTKVPFFQCFSVLAHII